MASEEIDVSCYPHVKSSPIDAFDLKYADWRSVELINLGEQNITIEPKLREEIQPEMWRNLVAEYDAANLCNFLRKRDGYSAHFRYFEDIWLHDELNHYNGLRFLYHKIYGYNEDDIHHLVISRTSDFSRIEGLIDSEFSTLVCFAYDELCSARGYAEAFELYDGFGVPGISTWIRRVARDEMFHSINAQRIILANHKDSLAKVPDVLQNILEVDTDPTNKYSATFLFDHHEDGEHNPFSASFLHTCAADICKYLHIDPPRQWIEHANKQ